MTLTRRQFIGGSAALGATAPILVSQRCAAPPADPPATLKAAASARGIAYGAYTSWFGDEWRASAAAQTAYRSECETLVAPVYMQLIRPEASRYDYSTPDVVAEVGAANGQKLRGHPLVWEQAMPDWLTNTLDDPATTRDQALGLMTDLITSSVSRYRGRVSSWDVVNEGIDAWQGDQNGLKLTPWRKKIGPEYLDLAFRAARDADPNAQLVYNETGIEYDIDWQANRRTATLSLLRRLLDGGAPITAFGVQSHLRPVGYDGKPWQLAAEELRTLLSDVAALGLDILVTELDCVDIGFPADTAQRDAEVAARYTEFLDVVLAEPRVKTVITWGISDGDTWLNEHAPRPDGLPVRSLPLDDQWQRKPAWQAMMDCFERAPAR
jgi:endo-1,4-beta-xylanase